MDNTCIRLIFTLRKDIEIFETVAEHAARMTIRGVGRPI